MLAFLNGIINWNIVKIHNYENNLSFQNGDKYNNMIPEKKKTFPKTDIKKNNLLRHQKNFTRIIAASRAPNRRSTWLN